MAGANESLLNFLLDWSVFNATIQPEGDLN